MIAPLMALFLKTTIYLFQCKNVTLKQVAYKYVHSFAKKKMGQAQNAEILHLIVLKNHWSGNKQE